jgi:hypothetical protein
MNQPTILAHIYTQLRDYEVEFWQGVSKSLARCGRKLFVLGSSNRTQSNAPFPYASFRWALDLYPIRSHKRSVAFAPEQKIADLLAREYLWAGEGNDEHRTAAIHHLYALYTTLLNELKPAGVLVMNGQHPVEMILVDLCRSRSIPVAFLERGPLPYSLHIDPESITAGSQVAKRATSFWVRQDRKNVALEKFLHYEQHYLANNETWWAQPRNQRDIRKQLQIPSDKKVILFANQLDNDTSNILFSPLHPTNLAALQWLTRKLEPMSDRYFLLGKHHPVNKKKPAAFRSAVGSLGVWTENYPLDACLRVADYVAAVNSTVLFEALMHRKPALQIGQSILSNKNIAYEVINVENGQDNQIVADWLSQRDFPDRLSRWHELGASLLEDTLFFMKSSASGVSLLNYEHFAAKLLELFPSSLPSGQPEMFEHLHGLFSDPHLESLLNNQQILSKYVRPLMLLRAFPESVSLRLRAIRKLI